MNALELEVTVYHRGRGCGVPVVHGLRWFGWPNTTQLHFLFPGQGSQSVGMGRDLYDNFAAARAVFEEADEALGFALSQVIFEGPEETLRLTEHTQPAILTVSTAAARVLTEAGVIAAMAAGHSLGEYSAHVAAGTLSFADAVRAVRLRGRYMQQAVPAGEGAMAAILGLEPGLIRVICEQVEDQLTPLPGDPAALNFVPGSAVVSAREPELAGADGDLGSGGGGGAGGGAVQAGRGEARRDAAGERALPLHADAAGAGVVGAGLGGAGVPRSGISGGGECEREAYNYGSCRARGAGGASDGSRALGGVHRIAGGRRERRSSSRLGRDAC